MTQPSRPIDRAPAHMRAAVDETRTAYERDPSDVAWDAYLTAVRACIDWCDAERKSAA